MFWNSNSTKMNPWISILFLLFKYYNVFTLLPSPPTFFFHFFTPFVFPSSLVLTLHCTPQEPPSNSCSLFSLNNMVFTILELFSFISIHVNCTLVWHMPFACPLIASIGILFLFWYVHVLFMPFVFLCFP